MQLSLTYRPPFLKRIARRLNNLHERRAWVRKQLEAVPAGQSILDAGCGSQQFRDFCRHLEYHAQDFGQYKTDSKKTIGKENEASEYNYGSLDYVGDVWDIKEADNSFDVILCTEVFEHIPYPNETIAEFSRLLKPNGILILTAPCNSLRHMDPYFFYSGFSDRWYEALLPEHGFRIQSIEPVGDYYLWIAVEIFRSMKSGGFFAKLALLPSFLYFFHRKRSEASVNTLCMGYHVLAVKD